MSEIEDTSNQLILKRGLRKVVTGFHYCKNSLKPIHLICTYIHYIYTYKFVYPLKHMIQMIQYDSDDTVSSISMIQMIHHESVSSFRYISIMIHV